MLSPHVLITRFITGIDAKQFDVADIVAHRGHSKPVVVDIEKTLKHAGTKFMKTFKSKAPAGLTPSADQASVQRKKALLPSADSSHLAMAAPKSAVPESNMESLTEIDDNSEGDSGILLPASVFTGNTPTFNDGNSVLL